MSKDKIMRTAECVIACGLVLLVVAALIARSGDAVPGIVAALVALIATEIGRRNLDKPDDPPRF